MAKRHVAYLKKIREFIKRKDVQFLLCKVSDPIEHGFCLVGKDPRLGIIIVLDPCKEFLATLIHECIHGIYPHYKERKAVAIEKFIMKHASPIQFKHVLLCFAKHGKLLPRGTSIEDIT